MILKWILAMSRWWHDVRDHQRPSVAVRGDWSYPKDGYDR